MATRIQIRSDTAANWTSHNPLLALGEFALESDTRRLKLGDGVNSWNTLRYYTCACKGMAVLDFGDPPGDSIAIVTVTGQQGIKEDSTVSAYIMGHSTASHNSYEHMIAPLTLRCGNIIENSSFDIWAFSEYRLTGTFMVHWVWE